MKVKQKILLSSLLCLFVWLGFLVKTNRIANFDTMIYSLVISLQSDVLTLFFKVASHLVHVVSVIVILLGIFFIRKRLALIMLIYVVGNSLLGQILKFIFMRHRPNMQRLIPIGGYSFPSAHAMMAMALYGFLVWLVLQSNIHKYIKIMLVTLFVVVILLVGTSRIYLGVHYASDVLAGYIISLLYLGIVVNCLKKSKITSF